MTGGFRGPRTPPCPLEPLRPMIHAVFAVFRTALALSMLGLVAAPAGAAAAPPPPVKEAWDRTRPRISAAWVRRNPVPGRPSAGYLRIEGGGQPDRLVGAAAPGVRIELHSMSMAGGVMKMARIDALPVPAGAVVELAPGGRHLMIFGLAGAARTLPTTLPITLVFASGARVRADATVREAAASDHMGH